MSAIEAGAPPSSVSAFQVFPCYVGTDAGCAQQPATYLLPSSNLQNWTSGSAITFSLPLLYTGDEHPEQHSYQNNDFSIAFSGTPPNVVANIVMKPTNLWACAAAARRALMASFSDLLVQVEKQLEATGIIVSGGTDRLRRAIAELIPAQLVETLYYHYGLTPALSGGTPYVDVQPGMRLRFQPQASQFLSPSSPLNGYVSTGDLTCLVGSTPGTGTRLTAFDAFLATIRAPTVSGGQSAPVVAGGLLDLTPTGGARRHWRLLYPPSVPAPGLPGDLAVSDNVTLLGAATLADLEDATAKYPAITTSPSEPNIYIIQLGRAMIVPEIQVWIASQAGTELEYVPVGTTVANIVERYLPLPLSPQSPRVVVNRLLFNGTGSAAPVTFLAGQSPALPSGLFDLPLLAGDIVTVATS